MAQFLHIDSKNRINGNSYDFSIELHDIDNDISDRTLNIQKISIPHTFYNINGNNNSISIGTTQSIVLDEGNYNITEFITEFNSNTLGITASYSSLTGKILYNGISGSNFIINADENQVFLGLNTGANLSITQTLLSPKISDLSYPREIRLNTDIKIFSSNSWDNNSDTLVSIFPNEVFGEYINYQIDSFADIKLNSNKIGTQRFWLTDEYNQKLTTCQDWNMTILLKKPNL